MVRFDNDPLLVFIDSIIDFAEFMLLSKISRIVTDSMSESLSLESVDITAELLYKFSELFSANLLSCNPLNERFSDI